MDHYVPSLPEGYHETARISFSDAPGGFLSDLKILWSGLFLILISLMRTQLTFVQAGLSLLLFAVSIYPYFVLHELLHAVVYKAATGQPVRVRFTKTGASCALPEGYLSRRTAILCTAAPLLGLGVLLVFAALLHGWCAFPCALLLTFHLLACRSDINLLRELKKYPKNGTLVWDNGNEQRIFQK